MPLFRCSQCGCIENTATSSYWWRVHMDNLPPICSECSDGQWHGKFPKRSADGMFVDQQGFLWGEDELRQVHHTTMRGRIVNGEEIPHAYRRRAVAFRADLERLGRTPTREDLVALLHTVYRRGYNSGFQVARKTGTAEALAFAQERGAA